MDNNIRHQGVIIKPCFRKNCRKIGMHGRLCGRKVNANSLKTNEIKTRSIFVIKGSMIGEVVRTLASNHRSLSTANFFISLGLPT